MAESKSAVMMYRTLRRIWINGLKICQERNNISYMAQAIVFYYKSMNKKMIRLPSFIPFLMLILLSFINESTSYASDKSVVTITELRFGNIKDITVLAHPVCRFKRLSEKNPENYILAEGGRWCNILA